MGPWLCFQRWLWGHVRLVGPQLKAVTLIDGDIWQEAGVVCLYVLEGAYMGTAGIWRAYLVKPSVNVRNYALHFTSPSFHRGGDYH